MTETRKDPGEQFFPYLAALFGLFLFRVLAQGIQAVYSVPFLPPFDSWQSGALPYPALLVFQIIILMVMGTLLRRIRTDGLSPSVRQYRFCFIFGGIYAVTMIFRLVAGLTFFSHIPWFNVFLPSVFHIVLASFVLLVGRYLYLKTL